MATLQNLLTSKTKTEVRNQLIQALCGVGHVRHAGTGSGAVQVSGTSLVDATFVAEILGSGEAGNGTATYRYSVDGGKTWVVEQSTLPLSLDLSQSLGVEVTFSGETSTDGLSSFIAGDTYTCQLMKPRFATTAWQPFSVPITLLDIQAEGLSDLTDLIASIGRGGILSLAEGDWLDLIASELYEVTRKPAVTAQLRFIAQDAASAGPFVISAGQLIARDARGRRFRNLDNADIARDGKATLIFEALEAGASHNAAETPLQLETTIAGLSLTPELGDRLIKTPGTERESDNELRERCQNKWGTIGRAANSDGYESWVREAVETVTRCVVLPSETIPGVVEVFLANDSGGATENEIEEARETLRDKLPTCVSARVLSCGERAVEVRADVFVSPGLREGLERAIRDGLTELFAETPIGGHVVGDRHIVSCESIIALIMGLNGVRDCELMAPVNDIELGATEVPVLDDASVFTIQDA